MLELQRIAEQGDWERLDELAPTLVAALKVYATTPAQIDGTVANRRQLEEMQQLLQTAMKFCATRKEQIAPLVNAFKTTTTSTDAP